MLSHGQTVTMKDGLAYQKYNEHCSLYLYKLTLFAIMETEVVQKPLRAFETTRPDSAAEPDRRSSNQSELLE